MNDEVEIVIQEKNVMTKKEHEEYHKKKCDKIKDIISGWLFGIWGAGGLFIYLSLMIVAGTAGHNGWFIVSGIYLLISFFVFMNIMDRIADLECDAMVRRNK